jgi:hypothetical protein
VSLALLVVATGFTDIVERLPRAPSAFEAHGELRMRTELLYNLDLDRTAGPPLFPIPASDPTAQTLLHADLRLRADLAAFAAGGMVAIRARLDVLGPMRWARHRRRRRSSRTRCWSAAPGGRP